MKTDFQKRVKDKFLKELETWLTEDLMYYYLTGDKSVDLEKLDHTFKQTLLDRAWKEFPQRLERIRKSRERKKLLNKARVKQFVLLSK